MKKAVVISAFSLALLLPTGLKSSMCDVFDAKYWNDILNLKSSISKLNREGWKRKADLYRRLVIASLKIADLTKDPKEKAKLLAEAWEAQHIGYRYWLLAQANHECTIHYYRNLVPRSI